MRLRNFFLTEMPRGRGDPTWAMLDWAAQQTRPFTIKQALQVYIANGGRAKSDDPEGNLGSFTSLFQGFVAKQHKAGMKPKPGKAPYWPPSERRPLIKASGGNRGKQGEGAGLFSWALDKPLRDPSTARFVNPANEPDEEETAGDAMDRLENEVHGIGAQNLVAAMKRWKKMPSIVAAAADIKATIPRRCQMDAMIVAADLLHDQGKASDQDVEDAEQEISQSAQAPTPADDDDTGEFSDEPYDDGSGFEDDEEEPAAPPPTAPKPAAKAPEPEPEEPEDDEVEEPTKQQAGAANFLKPSVPSQQQAPAKPKSQSPVSKFFKKKK